MSKVNNTIPEQNNSRSSNARRNTPMREYNVNNQDNTSKIKDAIMKNLVEPESWEERIDSCLKYEGPLLSKIWSLKNKACSQSSINSEELRMINLNIGSEIHNFHQFDSPSYEEIGFFYKTFMFIIAAIVDGTLEHKHLSDNRIPNFPENIRLENYDREFQYITEEELRKCDGSQVKENIEVPVAILSSSPFNIKYRNGKLYIVESDGHRIECLDIATGSITTVAGTGTAGSSDDPLPATSARLSFPRGLAVDDSGNVLIADTYNHRIRRVDLGTGFITTVAGNSAAQSLNQPNGVMVDNRGNVFIADSLNNRIQRIDTSGDITTVAGGRVIAGFSGDGGPAVDAGLEYPVNLAVDPSGNLLIVDGHNSAIRRVDASGNITTVAGNGTRGFSRDGGLATSSSLDGGAYDVAVDRGGNMFIAQSNRIRRVDARTGIITTFAGNGEADFSGDGGLATSASLNISSGVAVDDIGNIFIADYLNQRIRRVDASTRIITTIAKTAPAPAPTPTPAPTPASYLPPNVASLGGSRRKVRKTKKVKSRRVKKSRKIKY